VFDPAGAGMLVYGSSNADTTAVLGTIALALGGQTTAHCYVLDAGSRALAPLAALPHVGAVIGVGERERVERLIRFLTDELAQRRERLAGGGDAAAEQQIVLLIDNYAGLVAAFDDLAGMATLDAVGRIVADGPALGVSVVASADRATAVPPAIAATVAHRLVFAMADRHDYAHFGLAPAEVGAVPGRGVDAASGLQVQVARPDPGLREAVAAQPPPEGLTAPRPIGVLPATVPLAEVLDAVRVEPDGCLLPLGLGDDRLAPAGVRLGGGDHLLVTGPARSGKSTCLVAAAQALRKHVDGLTILAVAVRRSPLRDSPHVDQVATDAMDIPDLVERAGAAGPVALLVDDADATDDPGGVLAELLGERRDDLWVIAAGRADVLRSQYGHWTAEVRRSRQGLALRPSCDVDGDLWHTPLPRTARGPFPPGRGFLVADGRCELLQAASP
jgi:DNA segregation ATPase FtsK/SpoIIIE, S-DNA-T family